MLVWFVEQLKQLYGPHIISILQFGSSLSEEFAPRLSDVNLMVVLNRLTWSELVKLTPVLPQWVKAGNPPPVMLTLQELTRSADVFPMEYADIKAQHHVLTGTDPFLSLTLSDEHLREECEHELRGKFLKLRQSYALASDRPKAVRQLLLSSWSTFLIIGRHLLRLAGKAAPMSKLAIIHALADAVPLEAQPFLVIHQLRQDAWASPPMSWADLTQTYMAQLEKLIAFADQLKVQGALRPAFGPQPPRES